ncbi:hypothetical protein BKA63DRAFT_493540 [Paraphoma chrysanthemicola]|nr:hypothetical protein BKA63DRAFT_493540 [Paraphoma chrysanthemicola]
MRESWRVVTGLKLLCSACWRRRSTFERGGQQARMATVESRTARQHRHRRCSGESSNFKISHMSYSTAPAVTPGSALTCPWWQERRRSAYPVQRAIRHLPSLRAGQQTYRRKEYLRSSLSTKNQACGGLGDEGAKPGMHCQRRQRRSPPPADAHHARRPRESDTTPEMVPWQLFNKSRQAVSLNMKTATHAQRLREDAADTTNSRTESASSSFFTTRLWRESEHRSSSGRPGERLSPLKSPKLPPAQHIERRSRVN